MTEIFRFPAFLLLILMIFYQNGFSQQQVSLQDQKKLLDQSIRKKDFDESALNAYEIAKLYASENNLTKAIEYHNQTVSFSKKSGNARLGYLAFQHLGQIYTAEKNHAKALDSWQKGLKLAKELNHREYINEGLLNVAMNYTASGKTKKAIEPLEEALSLAVQHEDWSFQQKCYELLANYHQQLGNKSKSLEYKNLYENIVASKKTEEYNIQQLQELEKKIIHTSTEKQTFQTKLIQESKKLNQVKDSLQVTKYSLEEKEIYLKETEDSLREAQILSHNRELEIGLLNKDKELAEMQIQEQNSKLQYEAWIRYSIITGLFMASAFIFVVVKSNKKTISANKEIEKQNKNIKSSINYAKRIQEAMLPKPDQQKNLLGDSFILFKPRDSVSGDFYWMTEIKNWYNPDVVFAAADCTGHGVPGAFMSLIGINSLNGIITRGIAEPDLILHELDSEIRNALQQEVTGNNDGMDIALCIYRKEKNIIEYSGAKNPLVYVQNNELFQIKGDVHSIGGQKSKKEFNYKKHTVLIDQPTTLYMFSDGYRDQFGGEQGGKFMSKKFNQLLLEIHHLPLNEQMEILNKTFEDWKGKGPQTDDVLVMGIKLEPLD